MERREVRVREGGSCMHTDERPFSLSLSQSEVHAILYRSSLVVAEWGADYTKHPISKQYQTSSLTAAAKLRLLKACTNTLLTQNQASEHDTGPLALLAYFNLPVSVHPGHGAQYQQHQGNLLSQGFSACHHPLSGQVLQPEWGASTCRSPHSSLYCATFGTSASEASLPSLAGTDMTASHTSG